MRDEFEHFVLFFGVEDLRPEYAEACSRLGIPFAFVRKRGRVALRSHLEVLKTIRRVHPDVVMINGTPLAIPILGLRRLFRGEWAVVVRETQANHLKSRQEWLGSLIAARHAEAVVYLTEEYRTEVGKRVRAAARTGRAHVIPNGIDLREFDTGSAEASDRIRLSMVSRLVPIKDHATLIEAVRILVSDRKLDRIELTIAGEGPTLAALQAQVKAAGLSPDTVRLAGLLTRAEVAKLLRATDIYVHCTFGETMSNSILQAMASGLAVVASDVKGVANMVRDGEDGLLVPVEQPHLLADALERLIRSPATRRALGERARRRVYTELSQQRMVEQYRRLFARLTSLATGG